MSSPLLQSFSRNSMMRSIVLDGSRPGLVCGRRGRGSYAASIRRKLEGNDDTEEPLEEEDWDGFEPDDDPLEPDDDFDELED